MSTAEDEEEIPNADECERLCQEFKTITDSDTALGHYFLQEAQWNLEVALNRYFVANNQDVDAVTILSMSPTGKRSADESTANLQAETSGASSSVAKRSPKRTGEGDQPIDRSILKLLSWNIDGLDQNGIGIRTKAVCTIVLRDKPTIVFLQEVVNDSLAILADYLSDEYWVLKGKTPYLPAPSYFTAMLLKRDAVELGGEPEVIPFSGSLMERALLKIELKIYDIPCVLMTSHLESTKDCVEERVRQLRLCFDNLCKTVPKGATAFFGGDLNLRDKEVIEVGGIPAGVQDLWIACGSSKQNQFTWDCLRNDNLNFEGGKYKPRYRFDRLYIKPGDDGGQSWEPKTFGLVGTEKIQKYGRYPSDHFGIVCNLEKTGISK